MEWKNLERVLEEYAQKIRNNYQDKLIQDNKIASGDLLNSIEYHVEKDGSVYQINLSLEEYWKYVENGRGPGKFPPGDKILEWIKIKPVLPTPDSNGNLPTPDQLAYLIGRKIATEGINPGNQLEMTLSELMDNFEKSLDIAITQDIKEFLL